MEISWPSLCRCHQAEVFMAMITDDILCAALRASPTSIEENIEFTHPPISDAIPKFTERVMVQLPISQIQPIVIEMEISRSFARWPFLILVLTSDIRKWDLPFLCQFCPPHQRTRPPLFNMSSTYGNSSSLGLQRLGIVMQARPAKAQCTHRVAGRLSIQGTY